MKKSQILLLITALISIVLIGLIVFFLGLSSQSSYRIESVLISPKDLKSQKFDPFADLVDHRNSFSFSSIDLSYGRTGSKEVSITEYMKIYQKAKNAHLVRRVKPHIEDLFTKKRYQLDIFVLDNRLEERKSYQSMEFVDQEMLFRVQLKEPLFFHLTRKRWLYYQKEGLYELVDQIYKDSK